MSSNDSSFSNLVSVVMVVAVVVIVVVVVVIVVVVVVLVLDAYVVVVDDVFVVVLRHVIPGAVVCVLPAPSAHAYAHLAWETGRQIVADPRCHHPSSGHFPPNSRLSRRLSCVSGNSLEL